MLGLKNFGTNTNSVKMFNDNETKIMKMHSGKNQYIYWETQSIPFQSNSVQKFQTLIKYCTRYSR